MRPRARAASVLCGFMLAACLPAPASRGADAPPPAPWATLELKGGRVLHNAKVIADEPDSVVVRADEGLVKVAKASLPPAVAALYPAKAPPPAAQEMVMQPFDANPADAVRAPAEPAPKPEAKAADAPGSFKGCTLSSFQLKPVPNVLGCAEVVIHNDTDAAVEIVPADIVCFTTNGRKLTGRTFYIEGDPPGRKFKEVIPAHGDVDDILTFTNNAMFISRLVWAK